MSASTAPAWDDKPISEPSSGVRGAPRVVERLAVPIPEAEQMLGVRRSTIYKLMGAGSISSRKVGRRTLITTASIRSFLEGAPSADIAAPRRAA